MMYSFFVQVWNVLPSSRQEIGMSIENGNAGARSGRSF